MSERARAPHSASHSARQGARQSRRRTRPTAHSPRVGSPRGLPPPAEAGGAAPRRAPPRPPPPWWPAPGSAWRRAASRTAAPAAPPTGCIARRAGWPCAGRTRRPRAKQGGAACGTRHKGRRRSMPTELTAGGPVVLHSGSVPRRARLPCTDTNAHLSLLRSSSPRHPGSSLPTSCISAAHAARQAASCRLPGDSTPQPSAAPPPAPMRASLLEGRRCCAGRPPAAAMPCGGAVAGRMPVRQGLW